MPRVGETSKSKLKKRKRTKKKLSHAEMGKLLAGKPCVACQGSGMASKGGVCFPCKGSGRQ